MPPKHVMHVDLPQCDALVLEQHTVVTSNRHGLIRDKRQLEILAEAALFARRVHPVVYRQL